MYNILKEPENTDVDNSKDIDYKKATLVTGVLLILIGINQQF